MKFISWNVNGFRAVLKKGFEEIFNELDADFFCLQETKMQEGQADFHPEGYFEYYNCAVKKGYSGPKPARAMPSCAEKAGSWNVNGFRAVLKKGFEDIFKEVDADFFCLQETKMQEGQSDFHPEGYLEFYNYAEKKGYSGIVRGKGRYKDWIAVPFTID